MALDRLANYGSVGETDASARIVDMPVRKDALAVE